MSYKSYNLNNLIRSSSLSKSELRVLTWDCIGNTVLDSFHYCRLGMNDTVEYEDDNAGDLADEIEMQMAEVGDDELQSEKVEWKRVVVFSI